MSEGCVWCGGPVDRAGTRGPAPIYCKASCRQRAYEARRVRAVDAWDEQLVATFYDWWTNHPVPEVENEADAALDDVRSLVAALSRGGFAIIRAAEVR